MREASLSSPKDPVPTRGDAQVGVLALQGDYVAHARALEDLGARAPLVRRVDELASLDGLVLPGGESTALLRLFEREDMGGAIREFYKKGGAVFGTCAGLILLARNVTEPSQESLDLMDVDVRRNGFGRQRESFIDQGRLLWCDRTVSMPFIRAPRITRVGPEVTVLAEWQDEPVLVREGQILACTFHPEMETDNPIHRYFLKEVVGNAT